ncbi:glycoside hydrolase family 15 protein [Kribbella sp. NPDC051952]|uniref:glycoside hydrolase family 15 protein n=1 Tax=Kribbella sp. NPDC051952 TaxID=3154851 RepID=UPI003435ED49
MTGQQETPQSPIPNPAPGPGPKKRVPARRIEDYALIGDLQTAALVSKQGSIDWLCFPRFDSPACFAALLGTDDNGHWRIAPRDADAISSRHYRGDTLILETEWSSASGSVRVIDFMPLRDEAPDVVRIVEGISGTVEMRSELRLRFDYGQVVPWVRNIDGQVDAIAGPDAVSLRSDVHQHGRDFATYADFRVSAGDRAWFVLTWHPSHHPPPKPTDALASLEPTETYWTEWIARSKGATEFGEEVTRSILTLKALTYGPSGGIVAAPTTSLPESLGGERNWDYRFCWLRDATMTLAAMLRSGYTDEAQAWRNWLLRAIAGSPQDLQIMYGVTGERRLSEFVADWLPGFAASSPVRIGNAAAEQLQLDVFGEVMDVLALARDAQMIGASDEAWAVQRGLMRHLSEVWDQPDEGIWEVRGGRQHFTHSKVMAWVAFDRAARAVDRYGLGGPAKQWRAIADQIHRDVCEKAFDPDRNTFTQAYGSKALDAAVLLIPQVGFLPPTDPRVVGTVDAVQRELAADGFVRRYLTEHTDDGLNDDEGAFLICSFWLADALAMIGRVGEARELYEKLVALRNDVGLLAEEYDPRSGRMLGNFPQAFSHLGLVNTAWHLTTAESPVRKSAY